MSVLFLRLIVVKARDVLPLLDVGPVGILLVEVNGVGEALPKGWVADAGHDGSCCLDSLVDS